MLSSRLKPHQRLQLCTNFVHRYAHILGSMPQLVFQCALNGPEDVAHQLGLQLYQDNPAQHIPGLTLYLELINKLQSFASAITVKITSQA